MTDHHILYGMAGSLYTAKVRAYLRQNGIEFVEHKAGSANFANDIVPRINRWIVPVVETPDGQLLQDGTDILDHFEALGASRQSIYPQSPVMRAVAHLFELFGSEGLLRPAMHYRWNFDDENLTFLREAVFADVIPDGLDREKQDEIFIKASGRMRAAAVAFGVTPPIFEAIELSYAEFLALFNAHLQTTPYLLGGHPTIGDFAMLGPLYAHMGRDPRPLRLMQSTAPYVFRWTERMNMRETFVDENVRRTGVGLFADSEVPDTLKALMRYVADDYLGEITAHVTFANNWLAQQKADGVDPASHKLERMFGWAQFDWRGQEITTAVMLYRFYLLQRLTDWTELQTDQDQVAIRTLFEETGLAAILDLKTQRRVARRDYLEVWADER